MKSTSVSLAILSLLIIPLANAAVPVITIQNAPAGSHKLNFDDFAPGGTTNGPSGTATVSTTGNGAIVVGSSLNQYAAPRITNGNGAGFGVAGPDGAGATPDGLNGAAETTPYLSSGNSASGGSVTVQFDGLKSAVGLLWGSIDGYGDYTDGTGQHFANTNTLELLKAGSVVGTVTGQQVNAAFGVANTDVGRSLYVVITLAGGFDAIRATSINNSFEFDNVSYVDVPPSCDPKVCVLTQGYWKNHDGWPVQSLTLGQNPGVVYSKAQLVSILTTPVKGNGLISLAYQLIAAKLNVAKGACVPAAVADAIAAADALIGNLVVPPVGPGKIDPALTSALTGILDDYNNGKSAGGPSHCD